MRRSLIEQDDVEALGIVLAKLAQKDRETVRSQAGQLPPEGLACGRLDRRIEPVIVIEGLHHLQRFHPRARDPTAYGEMESQAAFVLAEDPHRLRGCLPP
jgi:hypothetical protein